MTPPKPIKLKPCPLHARIKTLEITLMCWSAVFSKYHSWRANKVPAKHWPDQIISDLLQVDALTALALKKQNRRVKKGVGK